MTPPKPVVAQLRVHDTGYPRNARIREHLDAAGFSVLVSVRRAGGPKALRLIADALTMWRDTRGADAAVLSEFSLTFVPLARLVTRLRGIPLIVDGFVRKYETAIEDWGYASARSVRARLLRAVDALSVRWADLYLIDTEVRAEAIRALHGTRTPVLGLPVGAPQWIRPRAPREPDGTLRILYFGGNIPLHGLPFALEALQGTDPRITLELVFYGPQKPVRDTMERAGIADRCVFHATMSHRELLEHIYDADVVLGIFGDSPKARTVVANKVWQGLAAGRVVVTRRTPAVEELIPVAGDLLELVDDRAGLTAVFERLRSTPTRADPSVADRLEGFVDQRFAAVTDWLEAALATRRTPR